VKSKMRYFLCFQNQSDACIYENVFPQIRYKKKLRTIKSRDYDEYREYFKKCGS